MSKQAVDKLVQTLTTLPPEDLARVASSLQGLVNADAKKVEVTAHETTNADRLVFGAIQQVLREARLDCLPWMVFARQTFFERFQKDVLCLMELLLDMKARTQTQKVHATILIIKVLANRLVKARCPISARTLAINLNKAHTAIDESFPGYRQNGMLGVIMGDRRKGYLQIKGLKKSG